MRVLVVEDEPDARGRGRQDGPIRRLAPKEPRVGPGRRGEGEGAENGEEQDADRQRLKKASQRLRRWLPACLVRRDEVTISRLRDLTHTAGGLTAFLRTGRRVH